MGSRQHGCHERVRDSSLQPQGPGCQGALASLHSAMKMFPPRAIPTTPWAEPGTGPSPRPRAQARARGRGHGRSRAQSQALGPGCAPSPPPRSKSLILYTGPLATQSLCCTVARNTEPALHGRAQHRTCVARRRATHHFIKSFLSAQMLILCGETQL